MANPYKEKIEENKKVKTLRIICAVLFFVEIILTTFPFVTVGKNETVVITEGIENGACWSAQESKDEYNCNNVVKGENQPVNTYSTDPEITNYISTVFFDDSLGWGNVNVNYCKQDGSWDKIRMSNIGEEGQETNLYSANIPADVQGITFDDRMDMTAFQLTVQVGGYKSSNAVTLALICAPLLILPTAAFFFMLLSKKSPIKYFISALCCVVCTALVTFGIGGDIAVGAVIAILLYILILFFTVVCMVIDYGGKGAENKK